MKKIIIILTLCLLGGMAVQAQAQNKKEKQEVVKLKNGHQVRGKIVTYAPLDSLVIQEDDGTLQTIYWDRIKQITKPPARARRRVTAPSSTWSITNPSTPFPRTTSVSALSTAINSSPGCSPVPVQG